MNKVYLGDCLNIMPNIDNKSIDCIICDLPFGVTARNKWDCIIPFDKLWNEYKRIIKDNGAIILHATQPFSSKLVMSNPDMYKYDWIWEKQQGTGFLNAKKQPLRNHEQILVFYKKQPTYNPQMREGFKPYSIKKGSETSNYNTTNSPNVESVSDGSRYPLTVLKYNYDKDKLHPTQKPVALMEYLVKTYTNEGDLILDNCAGSGTTLLAAKNLNRKFIGVEQEEKYYKIIQDRLGESVQYIEGI